jgi:hypothetical protein
MSTSERKKSLPERKTGGEARPLNADTITDGGSIEGFTFRRIRYAACVRIKD